MRINFNQELRDLYGRKVDFVITPPMRDPNDPNRFIKAAEIRPMTIGDLLVISLDAGKDHPEVRGKKRDVFKLQQAALGQEDDDKEGVEVPFERVALFLKLVDEQQTPSVYGWLADLLDPDGKVK